MSTPALRIISPADPARVELRAAIDAVTAANAAIDEVEAAHARAFDRYMQASRVVSDAKLALAAAEEDNQKHRLDRLLGHATEGASLSELKAAIETAETALGPPGEDMRLLEDERRRRQDTRQSRIMDRDAAIAEVLKPSVDAILAAIASHRQRVADLEGVLAALPVGTVPGNWSAHRRFIPGPRLVDLFSDAADALKTDADAPLPSADN